MTARTDAYCTTSGVQYPVSTVLLCTGVSTNTNPFGTGLRRAVEEEGTESKKSIIR